MAVPLDNEESSPVSNSPDELGAIPEEEVEAETGIAC